MPCLVPHEFGAPEQMILFVTRGDARRKLFHDAGHCERFCPALQIGTPSETDGLPPGKRNSWLTGAVAGFYFILAERIAATTNRLAGE